MKESNGSYKPLTYIPAGLMWGLNMLSPDAPFEDAQPTIALNKKPPQGARADDGRREHAALQ